MKPYYQDKWVTIYHGDCREILPQLDIKVDLVLTDPPYGVKFRGKVNKNVKHNDGYADTLVDDTTFIKDIVIPTITDCIARYGRLVTFTSNRNLWLFPPSDDIGCFYVQFGGGVGKWGFGSVNLVLLYGTDPFLEKGMGSRPNSWFVTEIAERNIGHPCPKPIGWISKLVARASFPSETILDPFLGSGTTCYCAKKLNRYSIGIEIEERYCEIAAKRCCQEVMEF